MAKFKSFHEFQKTLHKYPLLVGKVDLNDLCKTPSQVTWMIRMRYG